MNLTEIKTRVWDRLGEDATTPLRYTDEMIREFIDDGIQLFATLSAVRIKTSTITSIKDQRFYPLPTDLIRILSIRDDTTSIPLVATHWKEFDEGSGRFPNGDRHRAIHTDWLKTSVDRATHFFAFSWDEVALWPISSTTGRTYTMTYINDPGGTLEPFDQEFGIIASMTGQAFTSEFGVLGQLTGYSSNTEFGLVGQISDDDSAPITDIPQDYHMALVDYTVGRCLMINARGSRLNRAKNLIQVYRNKIVESRAQRGNLAANFGQSGNALLL